MIILAVNNQSTNSQKKHQIKLFLNQQLVNAFRACIFSIIYVVTFKIFFVLLWGGFCSRKQSVFFGASHLVIIVSIFF